mgnify:CR=1 FL=1
MKYTNLLSAVALSMAMLGLAGCEATSPANEASAEPAVVTPAAQPAVAAPAPAVAPVVTPERCEKHQAHDCKTHCADMKGKKNKACVKHCADAKAAPHHDCAKHCADHDAGCAKHCADEAKHDCAAHCHDKAAHECGTEHCKHHHAHECGAAHCEKHGGKMEDCCKAAASK